MASPLGTLAMNHDRSSGPHGFFGKASSAKPPAQAQNDPVQSSADLPGPS
jgi:hypothetical protein